MKYRNPSIVEALCELTFAPDTPWDSTIFGRLYELVKADFPEREEGEIVTATIALSPQAGQNPGTPHMQRRPRMTFSRDNRSRIVQVAERAITINALAPYPGWNGLRPMILNAAGAMKKVIQVPSATQIVLRYLDRFELQDNPFRLGDWLNCDGTLFPRDLADQSTALYQVQHPRRDGGHFALTAACGQTQGEAPTRAVFLDTQIIRTGPVPLDENLGSCLDALHDGIIQAFESA
ncbi:MAG: TIGR04255 family protein, partial [Phycisphaerae bacterium]